MLTIEFSEADIHALDHERFHPPHPRVQKKMEALYLKAKSLKHSEICRLCGISKPTLITSLKQYQTGGIEQFKHDEREPRLEEARVGPRKVYFMDAAHFVFRVSLGCIGCFARIFIPSPSGRKRFNVLGALDAVTHELITVTNTTSINSLSVCKLLDNIAEANHGLDMAITVFLDNARYPKGLFVQEYAAMDGIELVFRPSYSPNLNLIERYWKFVKTQCLYSK